MLRATRVDLARIINATFEAVKGLSRSKGEEYDDGENCLDNFGRVASWTGTSPETTLIILASKHWTNIIDYARDMEVGRERNRSERVEARIDDFIVYLCLLKAMIESRSKG